MEQWEKEVELNKLGDFLKETFTTKLKKSGETRVHQKWRLSKVDGNKAIITDVSNPAFVTHSIKRYKERHAKKQAKINKVRTEFRDTRKKLRLAQKELKSIQSGKKTAMQRAMKKMEKAEIMKREAEADLKKMA